MAAEPPIFDRKESADIRRRVGEIARDALDRLAEEIDETSRRRGLGISETWAKKFKIIADQIRRDFRLEGEELPKKEEEEVVDKDPLSKLRVVAEDEEVA